LTKKEHTKQMAALSWILEKYAPKNRNAIVDHSLPPMNRHFLVEKIHENHHFFGPPAVSQASADLLPATVIARSPTATPSRISP
jgi:hypothetical protein